MILIWRDKRMVTTMHRDTMEAVVERGPASTATTTLKPTCVVQYNKYMNGVVRMDQMISYCPFPRKAHRWSFKFIMYLFQLCFSNALVVYKAKGAQNATLLKFILSVVEGWTGLRPPGSVCDEEGAVGGAAGTETEEEEEAVPERVPAAPRYDPECRKSVRLEGHNLRSFPVGIGGKKRPAKACRWCKQRFRVRRETRYYCKACSYQPLCIECFFLYHKP